MLLADVMRFFFLFRRSLFAATDSGNLSPSSSTFQIITNSIVLLKITRKSVLLSNIHKTAGQAVTHTNDMFLLKHIIFTSTLHNNN